MIAILRISLWLILTISVVSSIKCYQCGHKEKPNNKRKTILDGIGGGVLKVCPNGDDCICNDDQGHLKDCPKELKKPICYVLQKKETDYSERTCVDKSNELTAAMIKESSMGCKSGDGETICFCEKDGCNKNGAMGKFDFMQLQKIVIFSLLLIV